MTLHSAKNASKALLNKDACEMWPMKNELKQMVYLQTVVLDASNVGRARNSIALLLPLQRLTYTVRADQAMRLMDMRHFNESTFKELKVL